MKKALSILIVILTVLPVLSFSQEFTGNEASNLVAGAEFVWQRETGRAPSFIRMRPGSEPDASQVEKWMRHVLHFGDQDGLILLNSFKDELGFTHDRYQQSFNGMPVEGTMYIAHLKDGKLKSLNGEYWPGLSPESGDGLSEQEALQAAIRFVDADLYMWNDPTNEKMLKAETGDPFASYYPVGAKVVLPLKEGSERKFRMVWKFDVYAEKPLSRQFIYVNAETANDRPEVQEFVQFYLDNSELVSEVGYVPLPSEAYTLARSNFDDRKTGSVFAGRETVGVRIADLLRLEAQ